MAKAAGNSYSPYLYLPRQPPTLPGLSAPRCQHLGGGSALNASLDSNGTARVGGGHRGVTGIVRSLESTDRQVVRSGTSDSG